MTQLYRRNLPHILPEYRPIFITFSTHQRVKLSPEARTIVLECCKHDHEVKAFIHAAVVMPDHVHVVLSRMFKADHTGAYELSEIMSGIKGASAHAINKSTRRTGRVWQDESFDHYLRVGDHFRDKLQYVIDNPVRAKLVRTPAEYPWLWTADPKMLEG